MIDLLLHYDWPVGAGEIPDLGAKLDVSGDPDKRVLKGEVWRHLRGEDGQIEAISIMLEDGQPGAEDFQLWVLGENDIGLKVLPG